MINWDSGLEVGVRAIDAQHQQMVNIYNELYSLLTAGHGAQVLAPVFIRLAEATDRHFEAEERLMADMGYPGLAVHQREHLELKRALARVSEDVRAQRRSPGIDLMAFLKDWLLRHIVEADMVLGQYLSDVEQ